MENNFLKRNLVYNLYGDELFKMINNSMDAFIVGVDDHIQLGSFSIAMLLYEMMDYKNSSICPSDDFLKCVHNRILCFDVSINHLSAVYTKSCEEINDDLDVSLEDGIGYMQIIPNDEEFNVNRIANS